MEYFQTTDVIKQAWGMFKKHMFFLWISLVIFLAVSTAFNILGAAADEESVLSLIITLVSVAVMMILELGLIRLWLDLVDTNTENSFNILWSQKGRFWSYLGASILYGLGVAIGLILFVIPGIYVALTYQFFGYLIVDKGLSATEALKKSAEITKGAKWQLLGFGLVMVGLNILGVLIVLVGLLVTIPVSILSYVMVYRALSRRLNTEVVAVAPATPPQGMTAPIEVPAA